MLALRVNDRWEVVATASVSPSRTSSMLFLSGVPAWTVERIAAEATSGLTQVAMQRAERLSGSVSPPKLRSLLTQFLRGVR